MANPYQFLVSLKYIGIGHHLGTIDFEAVRISAGSGTGPDSNRLALLDKNLLHLRIQKDVSSPFSELLNQGISESLRASYRVVVAQEMSRPLLTISSHNAMPKSLSRVKISSQKRKSFIPWCVIQVSISLSTYPMEWCLNFFP